MPLWTLLLLLPLLIFLLDVIGKIALGHSIRTTGADLCMFSLSFHVSTILIDQMTNVLRLHPDPNGTIRVFVISLLLMLASFILWLLGLLTASERFESIIFVKKNLRSSIGRNRFEYLGFVISVILGGASVSTVFYMLYVLA